MTDLTIVAIPMRKTGMEEALYQIEILTAQLENAKADKVQLVKALNEYFAARDDYDSVDCPSSKKFNRLDSAREELKTILANMEAKG